MSKNVVILNSRQGLFPSRSSHWVKNTIEAIKWVKQNQLTLLSSVGMNTWDIVTTLAVLNKINLRLFIPHDASHTFEQLVEYYSNQFNLDTRQVEFIPVTLLYEDVSKEKLMQARDRVILDHADLAIPISLRKTSVWYELLKSNIAYPHINNNFTTGYISKTIKQAYQIKHEELNPAPGELAGRYIFHYTRQPARPWPDEKLFDYYRSVIENMKYPRTALATLEKIVSTKKIIASSKNILGQTGVVSFTALEPTAMTDLIRWRKRYHQMSFEPYAIGFDKNFAEAYNIIPVTYYDIDDQTRIPEEIKWHFQSRGKISDWSDEKEYRRSGDFDFSKIPHNKLILITRFKNEAEELQKKTGIQSLPFTIY